MKSQFLSAVVAVAATVVIFTASSPAAAEQARPNPSASSIAAPTAPGSSTTDASAAGSKQRYCYKSIRTGTRIPIYDCRTRAEWLAQGFDPAAK